jgi:hypothetical protein
MGFLLVKISKELGRNRGLWSCFDISRYGGDERGTALFLLGPSEENRSSSQLSPQRVASIASMFSALSVVFPAGSKNQADIQD